MSFVHNDPEFPDLLEAVAADGPLSAAAMVEKDYWICHSLWALEQSGMELWFKGGTSLAKGFRLIGGTTSGSRAAFQMSAGR